MTSVTDQKTLNLFGSRVRVLAVNTETNTKTAYVFGSSLQTLRKLPKEEADKRICVIAGIE